MEKDRVSRENSVKVERFYGSASREQATMYLEYTSTYSNYSIQELDRVILDAKAQVKEFRMVPARVEDNSVKLSEIHFGGCPFGTPRQPANNGE